MHQIAAVHHIGALEGGLLPHHRVRGGIEQLILCQLSPVRVRGVVDAEIDIAVPVQGHDLLFREAAQADQDGITPTVPHFRSFLRLPGEADVESVLHALLRRLFGTPGGVAGIRVPDGDLHRHRGQQFLLHQLRMLRPALPRLPDTQAAGQGEIRPGMDIALLRGHVGIELPQAEGAQVHDAHGDAAFRQKRRRIVTEPALFPRHDARRPIIAVILPDGGDGGILLQGVQAAAIQIVFQLVQQLQPPLLPVLRLLHPALLRVQKFEKVRQAGLIRQHIQLPGIGEIRTGRVGIHDLLHRAHLNTHRGKGPAVRHSPAGRADRTHRYPPRRRRRGR